ncbi:hypothetical protein Gohar_007164 [Gossypium harknessii]|uniref:Uncharacterized protein n=1 Tax=Gossypium harknessii TaxID=34285 RepID=A0A7J9GFP5_9ROSI|nr:hypothetical protein [Gossypium harknessii]
MDLQTRQTRKVLMVVHWVPSKWMLLGKTLDGHLSLFMYLKMLKTIGVAMFLRVPLLKLSGMPSLLNTRRSTERKL